MIIATTPGQGTLEEDPVSGRDAIIDAAATCFMEAGYSDASIDDVAELLGATKGMVYHYFRSKADLFFEVQRRGMAINLGSIEPIVESNRSVKVRFLDICRTHLRNMIEHFRYQRVVLQGVDMHLFGATTPRQREKLKLLMEERERYEGMIRSVLLEGRQQGLFAFDNPSLASKAVLAILNNPVIWYQPRQSENEEDRETLIDEFTQFAMNSIEARQR